MADVDLEMLGQAVRDWEGARHGEKETVLSSWLPLLGIGRDRFYRELAMWGRETGRKVRADKGSRKDGRREGWVREIMALKHSRIKGAGRLATEDALRLALQWGRVPPEAAALSLPVINKMARQLSLLETPRRENRFEAEYPNQLHQVDASGSMHFFPYKPKGGEWILRVRPRQMRNKEKAERQKVWVWGAADDYSGFRVCRYTVAPGESAKDGIAFLQWAWEKNPDHAPFEGLPEILYMDNGVLAKHHAMQHFCREMWVELRTHEAYRPQATGKVESGWKDQWQRFESLFLRDPNWSTREISLSELNQEFYWFRRASNQREHRRLKISKEAAWLQIMLREGPVSIESGSWGRIFRRFERTLDAAGCFDLESVTYQVKDIWAARVRVYQGFISDTVLVEDLRDGQRYPAEVFAPKAVGEYRSAPKTELERLLEEGAVEPTDQRSVPLRPTWKPEADSNVVHLVRAGEVRESSFAMPAPERRAGTAALREKSLEEMAAGVEVLSPPPAGERLFATPLERYEHLLIKEARGEGLEPAEGEFMDWFRREYREMLAMAGPDLERRVGLAAVE